MARATRNSNNRVVYVALFTGLLGRNAPFIPPDLYQMLSLLSYGMMRDRKAFSSVGAYGRLLAWFKGFICACGLLEQ